MPLSKEEIHTRHSYQSPTELAAKYHGMVNDTTEQVALKFEEMLPDGREKALFHTCIEEARFWANAAIARNHDKLKEI